MADSKTFKCFSDLWYSKEVQIMRAEAERDRQNDWAIRDGWRGDGRPLVGYKNGRKIKKACHK